MRLTYVFLTHLMMSVGFIFLPVIINIIILNSIENHYFKKTLLKTIISHLNSHLALDH